MNMIQEELRLHKMCVRKLWLRTLRNQTCGAFSELFSALFFTLNIGFAKCWSPIYWTCEWFNIPQISQKAPKKLQNIIFVKYLVRAFKRTPSEFPIPFRSKFNTIWFSDLVFHIRICQIDMKVPPVYCKNAKNMNKYFFGGPGK